MADPFATIRKRAAADPSSFADDAQHLKHSDVGMVFQDTPLESAAAHLKHAKHRPLSTVVERVSMRDLAHLPVHWMSAMRCMAGAPVPDCARPDRWREIVRDAARFLIGWYDRADELGWSVENVFGYDPDEPFGNVGLALAIRSGRVCDLFIDRQGRHAAQIATVTGYRIALRCLPAGTAPLWALAGSGIDH